MASLLPHSLLPAMALEPSPHDFLVGSVVHCIQEGALDRNEPHEETNRGALRKSAFNLSYMEHLMDGSIGTSAYIDSAAGTLVWVRRRNGSWWPGRILGPDELPGAHLLSPRSGTPVKLLGREDASVDWYNIEKSKRVKAFRCGEFDDCIERARSLASLLRKKREKYARREDAILHALELEKQQIEHRILSRGLSLDRNSEEPSDFADDALLDDDDRQSDFESDFIDSESPTDLPQSVLSVPKSSHGLVGSQKNKNIVDAEWEDDVTEAIPRMRGLQDFGLRIASTKGKRANWGSACESAKLSVTEEENKIISCVTKSASICIAPNSIKASCPGAALKRKRSQAGPAADENAYKKRDRRRPLTQVLESSAKLPDGSFLDFDPGSKSFVPPFVPSSENGYTAMHLNQESKAALSETKLGSFSGPKGLDLQQTSQIGYNSKKEMLDSLSIMDKACSSFSNHLKTNCCDGGKPLYIGSQMEVAPLRGSALIDSLLRGGPASTCSFFSGSAHTASATSVNDTGFDKSSSLSVAENPPHSSSFQVWPNYISRELIPEKLLNGICLPGQSVDRAAWLSDCRSNPLEGTLPSDVFPIYTSHETGPEEHVSCMEDLETSLIHSRSDIHAELEKASKRSSRQGLSTALEQSRGLVTGEDEAESFQAIPVPSLSSHDVMGSGYAKHESFIEGRRRDSEAHADVRTENGFDPIHSQGGLQKSRIDAHGLASIERSRDGGLDETGFCSFLNRDNPANEGVSLTAARTVSKWQAKGRRNARVLGKNHLRWGLVHTGEANKNLVDGYEQGQEEGAVALDDVKAYNWSVKGPRPAYILDMHQEPIGGQLLGGEAHSSEKVPSGMSWESMQHVAKVNDCVRGSYDTGIMRSGNDALVQRCSNSESFRCQPQVQSSNWIDIPIEVRASFQGEHVPLVSLLSKLNGKAIVGHPVLVERLERRYGYCQSGAKRKTLSGHKGKKHSFQPVWRTARRTVMQRVPRSCSNVISQECDGLVDSLGKQIVQPISRLSYAGLFSPKNRIMRKSNTLIRCPSFEKRIPKKFSKKLGSSSQKTRMLSSLAVEDAVRSENTQPVTSKSPRHPLVTCIPVHLVFSRIREVLYKQSNDGVSDSEIRIVDVSDKNDPA